MICGFLSQRHGRHGGRIFILRAMVSGSYDVKSNSSIGGVRCFFVPVYFLQR